MYCGNECIEFISFNFMRFFLVNRIILFVFIAFIFFNVIKVFNFVFG